MFGLVLLEEALLGWLLLLFDWFSGVKFPAGADSDHKDRDKEQHEHMRELIGRDNAKIVLLTFLYLLLSLLLELLAL